MASGAVLIQVALRSAPTASFAPWANQVNGFCTGDADLGPFTIDGVNSTTFVPGYIRQATSKNSADMSRGAGFLASSGDGNFTFLDWVSSGSARSLSNLINAGSLNPFGAVVTVAYVAAGSSTPRVLWQGQVVDAPIGQGTVDLICKTSAYLQNKSMWGVRTQATISTDPDDPANPQDPTYAAPGVVSQFAGIGFGIHPVSLKAPPAIPVNKVAYYRATALATGTITTTGSVANVVATTATDIFNSNNGSASPDVHLPYKNFGFESLAVFQCRDRAETVRLYAAIKNLAESGYSIVLSDGQWFLDISVLDTIANLFGTIPASGGFLIQRRIGAYERPSIGPGYPYGTGVVFMLDSIAPNPSLEPGYIDTFMPPNGLDAAALSIYAVPSSVAIASQQATILGFAKNAKTVPPSGVTSIQNGITVFTPSCASADAFVSIRPIKTAILFDPNQSGNVLGGIKETNDNYFVTLAGAGSLADLSMDPASPWTGGAAPVNISGSVTGAATAPGIYVRMSLTPALAIADGDIFCVESTWKATFTANAGGDTRDIIVNAWGPFKKQPNPLTGYTYAFSPGMVYTMQSKANANPANPNWQAAYSSLAEMANNPTPHIAANGPLPKIHSVSMDVMECFIFAYSKLGFSSIYATIYPFWTQGKTSAIATYGANVVCDQGFGTVAADGSIQWAPIALPALTLGQIQVWGAAAHPAGWLLCGEIVGANPCVWTSPDGIAWSQTDLALWSGNHSTRIRWLNSEAITLSSHGHLLHTFAEVTVQAGVYLTDVAYDGTIYVVVGGNFVWWSSALTTFASVGPGGAGLALNCATWWNGHFYVAGFDSGTGRGKIYRATSAQVAAGTWVDVTPSGSPGAFEDFASTSTSLIAVAATGIIATNNGTSWKSVFTDGLYTTVNPWGWNFGAAVATVDGSPVYIVGSSAQILTSPQVDQGGTVAPTWTPWNCPTPGSALAKIRAQYLGGNTGRFNPVQWTENGGGLSPSSYGFGVAFDPPDNATTEGANADAAARLIAKERWFYAGEMSATKVDGSSDTIERAFPEIRMGNVEDVATTITIQYQPFGGQYLSTAYVQNVDVDRATAGMPDAFFFGGWDDGGNANGLAIWTACRNAYLKTGINRPFTDAYKTVHDATTMGRIWTTTDADMGQRIAHLCKQPRYLLLSVSGNDSAAAIAAVGTRYKANQTLVAARGMSMGGSGYGVIVNESHDYLAGSHKIAVGFAPAT